MVDIEGGHLIDNQSGALRISRTCHDRERAPMHVASGRTPLAMVVQAPFHYLARGAMLEATAMPHACATVRVLIVDDQSAFRHAARSVVELTPGFVVVGEVATGEASLDAAAALRPDLVLMDVHLPGIDGFETSRRLLATCGTHAPVILLLSTDEAGEYLDEPSECGAAAYLTKAAFGSDSLSEAWAAAVAAT